MAETAKILAPDKKVVIPEPQAGCPLADQASQTDLIEMKKNSPEEK